MTYRIATIIGSLRQDSTNRRVAEALIRLAPEDLEFFEVRIGKLPLYNQDHDSNQAEEVRQMKSSVEAADAVLFVTPEYNRSIPGVLKNALDHGSRPYGGTSWSGRPAGIVGVSLGAIGTSNAQQHLRNILAFLNMPTFGQPEAYIQWTDDLLDADGNFKVESRGFFQGWMDGFAAFVRKNVANQ